MCDTNECQATSGETESQVEKLRNCGVFHSGGERIWPNFPQRVNGKLSIYCAYCGRDLLENPQTWTSANADHILPQKTYERLRNEPSNHAASCSICNNLKGTFDAAESMPEFREADNLMCDDRLKFIDAAKKHIMEKREKKQKEFDLLKGLLQPPPAAARAVGNLGFDNRIFLHESEWLAYCRRKPVRYTDKPKAKTCEVCGLAAMPGNALQNAHVIEFGLGVVSLALTPEFLDSHDNLVSAHTKTCNQTAELSLRGSMLRLRGMGVVELPFYLPDAIRDQWSELSSEKG